MDRQTSHVGGAEAPQRPTDPTLRDTVAGLLRLSVEESGIFDGYDIDTCNDLLQGLVEHANHPTGKSTNTIRDMVGQIFLVYHRRTQLQEAESRAQMAQLQRDLRRLRAEAHSGQEEMARVQEDSESLLAQVEKLQTGLVSMVAGMATQRTRDVPEPEDICPGSASPQESARRNAAESDETTKLRLQLQASQVRERDLQRRLTASQPEQAPWA